MPHTNNPNGKWELPSGHIHTELDEEAQQAAVREWEEETGLKLPPGRFVRQWDSSNGKFVGFVYEIDSEDQLDLCDRDKDSNPDGDHFEALAWVDPHDMPYHNLRHELMDDIGRVQAAITSNAVHADVKHQGEMYTIYKNPSTRELRSIIKSDPERSARGIIHPETGDAYIWGMGEHALEHREVIHHHMFGEVPSNSHKIFLQSYKENPNEIHMSARGASGEHINNFISKHGLHVTPTENELELIANHSFSSTQFDLAEAGYSRSEGSPVPRLQQLQDRISNKDLTEDGKEERFHVTVKYGIHTDNANEVRDVVLAWLKKRVGEPGFLTVHATLGDISLFSNPDADVVKIGVDSEDLHSLNKALSSGLDCTDTHPTYNPHITLAYVKPGRGSKYVKGGMNGQEILLHKLIFSDKDRQETVIDLWEVGKDLRSEIQEETSIPTENERTDEQREAELEARQATAGAYRATSKLPGRDETINREGWLSLSPRAKAHQHAGLASSRSRISAYGLAYMHHMAAAARHHEAAEESDTVGERLAHREAAEAHEEAALANKKASRMIETVRNEEGNELSYISNTLLTYNVLDINHKGEIYSIYKNPSTRVIKSILKSDPYHGIRGLIHPETGDVYLWGNGEGGLEHKEVVNHYLREELPYNSHKIYLQQTPSFKEGHPPEIHMDTRGRSSEHITNFAKQHGIHIMGGMADNTETSKPFVESVSHPIIHGHQVTVVTNPTRESLKRWLKKTGGTALQGIAHEGNVHVSEPFTETGKPIYHADLANALIGREPKSTDRFFVEGHTRYGDSNPRVISHSGIDKHNPTITKWAEHNGMTANVDMTENEWTEEARRKNAEARRMRKKIKPTTALVPQASAPRPARQEPVHQPTTPSHDVAKNRPSKPHERHKNSAPPTLSWKDPPPKKGKKGTGPIVRPKGEHSQTKLGDHAEELATSIGFRNILPEGRRSNKNVAEEGSSVDLEWNHSGKAMELKMCSTNSTEFRLKAKSSEKIAKMEYAKKHGLQLYTMIGIRDADRREIHYYVSKEPGLIDAEVSPKHFDYCGTVSF